MKLNFLARSVCEAGKYPHNRRVRWTNGFRCEDCNTFIYDTDEDWFYTTKFGGRSDRPAMGVLPVYEQAGGN